MHRSRKSTTTMDIASPLFPLLLLLLLMGPSPSTSRRVLSPYNDPAKPREPWAAEKPGGPIGLVYGGMGALPSQFPYFVQFNNCGGALIRPDLVLTAAHCGSYQGEKLYVGAVESQSTEFGAVERTCVQYIRHPEYSSTNGAINDFALCKLDHPVTIEQDEVVLRLADSSDHVAIGSIVGKELVSMGFGSLNGDRNNKPDILQWTTLEGRECDRDPPIAEQVCAGGTDGVDGVTDVCWGDSGGPLIMVFENATGPDIHLHVGLVSSGAECPTALTGTYANTSTAVDWIPQAACMLEADLNCPAPPEPPVCGDDEVEIVVSVLTDRYPYENNWVLESRPNNRTEWIMGRGNNLEVSNRTYTDVFCTKSTNQLYKWTIFDTYGDGLCFQGQCGSYSLTLDGEEIDSGASFGTEAVSVFAAGNCVDSSAVFEVIRNEGQSYEITCDMARNYRTQACQSPVVGGGIVADYCAFSCGQIGIGRCAASSS